MLQTLMDKVDCMQEQMNNVCKEVEILRKNQKEMLQIKKHCNRNEEFWWGCWTGYGLDSLAIEYQ